MLEKHALGTMLEQVRFEKPHDLARIVALGARRNAYELEYKAQ